MPQRWSPQDVLQLSNDNRCIGDAPSKRRKCLRVVNSGDMRVFNYMLKDLAEEYPDADIMKSKLERLAHLGLCVANHRNQQEDDVVRKWSARIRAAFPPEEEEEEDYYEVPRRRARSTVSRQSRPVGTSSSSNASELETLQETIAAMQETIRATQRRLDMLQQAETLVPATARSPAVSRVSTADIPNLALSRASTMRSTPPPVARVSMFSSTTPRFGAASVTLLRHEPSPALQSPTPNSASSRSSLIIPSNTTSAASTTTTQSLTPSSPNPVSSSSTPTPSPPISRPSPSPTPPKPCTLPRVRRLPLDTECPVCYEDFPLHPSPTDLVWCHTGCGRTVHASCFADWRSTKLDSPATCMVCRGAWCECVGCDEIHVKRREVEGESCSICLEGFGVGGVGDGDTEGEGEGDGDGKEALEWCKMGCGKNVHGKCFAKWKEECVERGREVRCTDCRTGWVEECECAV